ncbi:MAG: GAF domain-containing protein [Elainellaceae cyanobacterium]
MDLPNFSNISGAASDQFQSEADHHYSQRQYSHILVAQLDPMTLAVQRANAYFYAFTGIEQPQPQPQNPAVLEISNDDSALAASLRSRVSLDDQGAIAQLCRYHILYRLLQHLHVERLAPWRILSEPVMISMRSALHRSDRSIQAWIRSEALQFDAIDDPQALREALGIDSLSSAELGRWLNSGDRIGALEQRLQTISYHLTGHLWIEGVDVTATERVRSITQLLVDQNSVLQAEKFKQVNVKMCELFDAVATVIICFQGESAFLFMGDVSDEINEAEYSFKELEGGAMMAAIEQNRVVTVPDLTQHDMTDDLKQKLLDQGLQSVMIMPLVVEQLYQDNPTSQGIGLVCLLSPRPYHFDQVDCRRAEQLVPAFTSALANGLRQLHQKRFLNSIHPSVEWRFIQEAERRSLGLAADPIVFQDVFPLYGISDIRGSSNERNASIQADLLEQLQLGLAIIEAVCEAQPEGFCEQLRLDLLDIIADLETGITVDAEVTIAHYLSEELEAHFDSFAHCSEEAKQAIAAYWDAYNPAQGGVYKARARYDLVLEQINTRLRDTWEKQQRRMQRVIPHYCDVEVTDGIDHMIYVGAAIANHFQPFHLKCLRYEQLRSVCACARMAFSIKAEFNTNLDVTHLVLVQDSTVDIFHDEDTERLFDVRGTRDTRYEIVKKRIDKAIDEHNKIRITQPGMLTIVYSTEREKREYQVYLRYLDREKLTSSEVETGEVEPLQGVNGLKFMRVQILPA